VADVVDVVGDGDGVRKWRMMKQQHQRKGDLFIFIEFQKRENHLGHRAKGKRGSLSSTRAFPI